MTYWLGIDTPAVWAEAQRTDNNRFGFPAGRRRSVQQMQPGDRIINYMTKQKRFFAVWEVTKGHVHDPDYKFAGREFPECVEIREIIKVPPKNGIENYGLLVRQSAVRLRDEDGDKILSALQEAKSTASG
jgi:EVE domain-containing protein